MPATGYTTTGTKTAPCAGCGHHFPHGELTAVEEGALEFLGTPLAHFPGELLCGHCYGRAA